MAKKSKKRMRLPNGIGSVHQINDGKRRRKPWRARVPSHVEFVDGVAKQKYITLGYYEKEEDAIAALFDYRKNPYTLEASTATFADVFEMWKLKKYPDVSPATRKSYNAAYANSAPLHNMKMRDIRTLHLEHIMQTTSTGYGMQTLSKTFWGQLFKYAIEHDIVQKNYATFVKTRDKIPETTRTAISPEDIKKIWQAIDEGDEIAEVVMIYIYTGFRLSELLEIPKADVDIKSRILVGGKKTSAGKNRRIPIHKCILPFIEKRMKADGEWLFPGRGRWSSKSMGPQAFASSFDALMEKLGTETYTPHYARHTFATMLRTAGIEEDLRKLLMGHASGDITDRYTHVPDSMLVEAIDKLPGRI